MAFFLGHFASDIPSNSTGGSLGLLTHYTNGTGDGTLNPENADISDSHVAIDVNSVNSTATKNTTSLTTDLTSSVMTATVRYVNVTKLLAVQLVINGTSYNVNTTVDLRSYLPERVAVGFSAATGYAGELNQILSWSFTSTLQ